MKKVLVFTGNRAEIGILSPVIDALSSHQKISCSVLISGSHCYGSSDFGSSEKNQSEWKIAGVVPFEESGGSHRQTAISIGSGIVELARFIDDFKPDLVIVYGDRFEAFAAATAAFSLHIPIAHIEGGDITNGGTLDDTFRHAITKLSSIHFVTNENAKKIVSMLGEENWRIHNVGLPSLDYIYQGKYASESQIFERYNLNPQDKVIAFTQHSVAAEFYETKNQIIQSIDALNRLANEGFKIIATYPNNDAGSIEIINVLIKIKHPNIQIHRSLGRYYYHGLLNVCGKFNKGVCVGNSSSGIKETMPFRCPVVNIGTRQAGRLRGGNVLDTDYSCDEIYNKIKFATTDQQFRVSYLNDINPYGDGMSGLKIANLLSEIQLKDINIKLHCKNDE